MNERARLVLLNLRGVELPPIDYSALANALSEAVTLEMYQKCSRRVSELQTNFLFDALDIDG